MSEFPGGGVRGGVNCRQGNLVFMPPFFSCCSSSSGSIFNCSSSNCFGYTCSSSTCSGSSGSGSSSSSSNCSGSILSFSDVGKGGGYIAHTFGVHASFPLQLFQFQRFYFQLFKFQLFWFHLFRFPLFQFQWGRLDRLWCSACFLWEQGYVWHVGKSVTLTPCTDHVSTARQLCLKQIRL